MPAKVFIILPVFNRLNFSRRCLSDISRQTYPHIQTVMIDDGSTDGTFEFVRHNYPQVHIIRGDGQWWWSKSAATGIDYALAAATDHDYVLLLNNDCFFGPNYIRRLLKTARKYPRSIIGSFCLTHQGRPKVVEAGIRIYWPTGIVYSVAEAISTNPNYYRHMEVIDQLDALPGKGTLVPVPIIKDVGNINFRRLPHYIADYEFTHRAKRAGYQLLVDVKSLVRHDWGATGYRSTGGESILSYSEAWTLLFGRKSMNNIIDWVNFLLLACPKPYLRVNLWAAFWRLVNGGTRVWPLTGLRPILRLPGHLSLALYRLRLTGYQLSLKVIQFPQYYLKLRLHRLRLKITQFSRYHLGWQKH